MPNYLLPLSLQHDFVNRVELCAMLMLPLIKNLEAPKSRTPVLEDYDDDEEKEVEENKKSFKRISSVKNKGKIDRQMSEADSKFPLLLV